MRAVEKSAEAVVARKRLKGRGAKGRRTQKQTILSILAGRREVVRNNRCSHYGSLSVEEGARGPVDSGLEQISVQQAERKTKGKIEGVE